MQSFNGPNTCPPIIADIELVSSITGVVIWAGVGGSVGELPMVVIIGPGNQNVFFLAGKRKS